MAVFENFSKSRGPWINIWTCISILLTTCYNCIFVCGSFNWPYSKCQMYLFCFKCTRLHWKYNIQFTIFDSVADSWSAFSRNRWLLKTPNKWRISKIIWISRTFKKNIINGNDVFSWIYHGSCRQFFFFKAVKIKIRTWVIDCTNSPTLFLAVVFALMQVVTYIMVYGISKQLNLRRNDTSSNNNREIQYIISGNESKVFCNDFRVPKTFDKKPAAKKQYQQIVS